MIPPHAPGAVPDATGTRFTVWSEAATVVSVVLTDREVPLDRHDDGWWSAHVPGIGESAPYALRAEGPWAPEAGHRFDATKLLADPYAREFDRPWRYDPALGERGEDTSSLVPRAIVRPRHGGPAPEPVLQPGGVVYEASVRSLTMRHPEIPAHLRGTVAALAHPAIIDHMQSLHVNAIELMPVTAWIDERHLPPLGLTNAWGYNPVTFMAPDCRLCPGGLPELRETVATLRDAGIGTLLDVVFNHTGESDTDGPTVSFRGLANTAYYRHADGGLVNDTGCGNTVACDHPVMRQMILDTLRLFRREVGVDGFRFDLGPVLGRTAEGFDPQAETLRAMREDPEIGSGVLIMEPWDIGPGGYQLGQFGEPFLEWNDRARDDIRRFWKGEGSLGDVATRLAGSSDLFDGEHSRSVDFVAAHDGFTLWDLVSHEHKHNAINGEQNRDGHNGNHSWNNGVEGPTEDAGVDAARRRDVTALLGTLFAARGTVMITAGDEMGRSQQGNNNAYAQDNHITWVDWEGADPEILAAARAYAGARAAAPQLGDPAFLTEETVAWCHPDGSEIADWHGLRALQKRLPGVVVAINGTDETRPFARPPGRWRSVRGWEDLPPRSVDYWLEAET
ncbi:glycogen debranching protein GlgX [Pontivivens ytuae]|uniref:Glycogen debranching protein GlgX n=1 Tax=Pontivivens ytuae TaxID=2789856 RepID=A0A7S9LTA8_9RHOB|nr:glycogen debranching protein GlgX [Pontivivens ytuae]QPH54884.1 glycogen debranching protein GlgX [Pontivivens ytuae]